MPLKLKRRLNVWLSRLHRGRAGSAARILEDVQRDLTSLSHATEGVFLQVGQNLGDLQSRTCEIASEASRIAEILSGDGGALHALDRVLNSRYAHSETDEIAVVVSRMQEHARGVRQAIESIGTIIKSFDVLCVMTRMESARFERAGELFTGLADSVSSLARQIRREVSATADAAAVLYSVTTKAAQQMQESGRRYEDNLMPLTTEARADVHAIQQYCGRVSEAGKLLSTRFKAVSHCIGDLVSALQVHDIVRQQVEHILERLGGSDVHDPNLPDLARLQAAQLRNARNTFESSVHQLQGALADIQRNVGEAIDESSRLFDTPGSHGSSRSDSTVWDVAALISILESDSAADVEFVEALKSVRESIEIMSAALGEAVSIGFQMQRTALNATIHAAQLGTDGAALEIVAQAIQTLARNNETASETLDRHLRALDQAAASLAIPAGAQAQADVMAQLRDSSEALSTLRVKAHGDYIRTAQLSLALKEGIQKAADAFGTQHECLRVMDSAARRLEEIGASSSVSIVEGGGLTTSLYTMEAERAVHQEVFGQIGESRAVLSEAVGHEENVEFF
ncbi:MAG: hypothetical protein U0Q18_24240 [Bryobacteraceae bacterium]